MIVPTIVQQHADDVALLGSNRIGLVDAPHATLQRLHRFDHRLAAHLDGLRIAGEPGWALCETSLETPSPGSIFAVAVRSLEDRDEARFARVIALVQAVRETITGLLSAFEWVEPTHLQGTVASLIRSRDVFRRMLGVAACALHRVDPRIASDDYLHDTDPMIRARARRAAGELGVSEAGFSYSAASRRETHPEVRFWTAWSAVLLGDRDKGVAALSEHAMGPGTHRARAFRLALQSMVTSAGHTALQKLVSDPKQTRWLIQGSGIVGDPACIPWLIKRMAELSAARLSGEAFTLITGIDLGAAALDRPTPEGFESGPNDDPDDPIVDMDPDDGLPWPDVARVEKWWATNEGRFQKGTRYFMGAPVAREHCIDVLKNGYQRQRILAAHYLCLLDPGTPLFNTSAPAWRQQRLLAKMA
jgi:uncharacterized protein (TIGR02270 family)